MNIHRLEIVPIIPCIGDFIVNRCVLSDRSTQLAAVDGQIGLEIYAILLSLALFHATIVKPANVAPIYGFALSGILATVV